jgi:Putative adhesin
MTVMKSSRVLLPLAAAAAALAMSACAQPAAPAQVQPAGISVPQAPGAAVPADASGADGADGADESDVPAPGAPRPGEPAPTEVTTEQVTGPVARLEVMTAAGRVTVRGSDAAGVSVTRSIYRVPVAPQETVRHDGDLLHIESQCPQDNTPTAPCRIDYDITAPRATLVTLVAASGDLTTTGLTGPVAVKSVSGDVELAQHRSPSTVAESTSGDVEVHLLDRPDTLSATSVSGDVQVRVPDAGPYKVNASTVSGDTELGVRSDPSARAQLNLRTTSGDLTVTTG